MAWYDTGTVSVTNGSTTVTGSGTNFVSGAQIGEAFYGPDDSLYEIEAIVSATELTLADAYLGSTQSGQNYKIIPTQSLVADLAGQVTTLINDFQTVADEAGEGKFDDGSAASPGITFTQDQDTGFYRETANEIGISVGGSKIGEFNSSGLTIDEVTISGDLTVDTTTLYVDSTNNRVGIGTSSPATLLDVNGLATLDQLTLGVVGIAADDADITTPGFYRTSDLSVATNWPSWMTAGPGSLFVVQGVNGNNVTQVAFGQNGLDTGVRHYRASSWGSWFRFAMQDENVSFDDVTIADKIIHSGDTNTSIRFPAADTFTVETAGSEAMRINSSGNVGIGTSSPASALDVVGTVTADGLTVDGPAQADDLKAISNTPTVQLLSPSGTNGYQLFANISDAVDGGISIQDVSASNAKRFNIANNGDISFYEGTGTTPKFFWDASAERLGIGTSSPSAALDVNGRVNIGDGAGANVNADELVVSKDATNVGMSLLCEDATGFVRLYFGSQTDKTAASIRHQENNDRLFVQAKGELHFQTGGTNTTMTLDTSGDLDITGALSKGSGSFKIDHPLKPETHHLVHSFIEGPQADNIYRGTVALVGGTATVNLDTASRMSEGTFVALNGNVQCFTSNEDGWTAVRGRVSGNILTIEAQDETCTDTVSWMVVGERHDKHMLDTAWTDAEGRVITEPEKTKDQQEDDA